MTLTEREHETSAVGVWRVCSWRCLLELASRKVHTER